PDEVQIGTVHEEWAVESRPGDVFLLGTHSWRISRVEPGTVRVTDAHGAPPSVPHWQGEAPGRTRELSEEVSALRQAVADRDARAATARPRQERGIGQGAAPGPGCNKSAASAKPRPRPSWPTCGPGWSPWARCPRWRPSSWSASSTRL